MIGSFLSALCAVAFLVMATGTVVADEAAMKKYRNYLPEQIWPCLRRSVRARCRSPFISEPNSLTGHVPSGTKAEGAGSSHLSMGPPALAPALPCRVPNPFRGLCLALLVC
jgi:hypothetical protein